MSIVATGKRLAGSSCHLVRRYRPYPRPHCARWGTQLPLSEKGTQQPPTFRPMSIVAKRSPISESRGRAACGPAVGWQWTTLVERRRRRWRVVAMTSRDARPVCFRSRDRRWCSVRSGSDVSVGGGRCCPCPRCRPGRGRRPTTARCRCFAPASSVTPRYQPP